MELPVIELLMKEMKEILTDIKWNNIYNPRGHADKGYTTLPEFEQKKIKWKKDCWWVQT